MGERRVTDGTQIGERTGEIMGEQSEVVGANRQSLEQFVSRWSKSSVVGATPLSLSPATSAVSSSGYSIHNTHYIYR